MITFYVLSAISVAFFVYNTFAWFDMPHEDMIDKLSIIVLSFLIGSIWIIIPILLLFAIITVLLINSFFTLCEFLHEIRS
jgi:hypothetical protein